MPVETVRVAFLEYLNNAPVPGVFTRVFDTIGNLITTALSDVDGLVEFELMGAEPPGEYQLRFYLPGATIPPKRIEVYSPAALAPTQTNDFVVYAEVFSLAVATDPKLCRCSGFLVSASGKPRPGVDVSFIPQYAAFVEGIRTVATGRFVVRTDKKGFLSVDLYRYGIYTVLIEGREPIERSIQVPDRGALLLGHLLFPIVVQVQYLETGPYTVLVGETLQLTPRVMASDYRDLGLGFEDVTYDVRDPAVAAVQVSSEGILVTGLSAGTTQLRVTRRDNSTVYLPDFTIAGSLVSLVVTQPVVTTLPVFPLP